MKIFISSDLEGTAGVVDVEKVLDLVSAGSRAFRPAVMLGALVGLHGPT